MFFLPASYSDAVTVIVLLGRDLWDLGKVAISLRNGTVLLEGFLIVDLWRTIIVAHFKGNRFRAMEEWCWRRPVELWVG